MNSEPKTFLHRFLRKLGLVSSTSTTDVFASNANAVSINSPASSSDSSNSSSNSSSSSSSISSSSSSSTSISSSSSSSAPCHALTCTSAVNNLQLENLGSCCFVQIDYTISVLGEVVEENAGYLGGIDENNNPLLVSLDEAIKFNNLKEGENVAAAFKEFLSTRANEICGCH